MHFEHTTDYRLQITLYSNSNDDNIMERQAPAIAEAVAAAVATIFNMDYSIYFKSYAEKS